MKTNQRISAFTISELIIVLIITSIVVGLAYSTLRLVHSHFGDIKKNYTKKSELNKLEASLWIDFNRFSEIEFNSENNALKFSNVMNHKTYSFEDNHVVRDKDTFRINLISKDLFFNGETIEKGRIDAIKLQTSKEMGSQQLFVFKKNAATQYLN